MLLIEVKYVHLLRLIVAVMESENDAMNSMNDLLID